MNGADDRSPLSLVVLPAGDVRTVTSAHLDPDMLLALRALVAAAVDERDPVRLPNNGLRLRCADPDALKIASVTDTAGVDILRLTRLRRPRCRPRQGAPASAPLTYPTDTGASVRRDPYHRSVRQECLAAAVARIGKEGVPMR